MNRLSFLTLVALILLFQISCNSVDDRSLDERQNPSLEEMIGQMIMVGFRGFNMEEISDTVKQNLLDGKIGSIVLFDYDVINKKAIRNIQSPAQLKQLIQGLQEKSKVPLLVAVDQEGGRVNRLKEKYGFPKSVSNQYLGQLDDLDSTRYYAKQNAETLAKLGFNVNFSPDVDLNINPENPVIGKIGRSYSDDVNVVVRHASTWIEEHKEKNILSTLKHFPGHGSSDADSHYGVTDITKYWSEAELEPFKQLIKEGDVAIMTAHVINGNLDTLPATLSTKIIKEIIRDEWAFDGLVFSDDLHMAAVNAMFDFETILEKSIKAGVDVLVFGNNLKYDLEIPNKVITSVKKMVEDGKISEDRIAQSYQRILSTKKALGIIK